MPAGANAESGTDFGACYRSGIATLRLTQRHSAFGGPVPPCLNLLPGPREGYSVVQKGSLTVDSSLVYAYT